MPVPRTEFRPRRIRPALTTLMLAAAVLAPGRGAAQPVVFNGADFTSPTAPGMVALSADESRTAYIAAAASEPTDM